MIPQEKRSIARLLQPSEHAYIEIEHTFGTAQKNVYKIVEYTECGLSFHIPFNDGYFLVGTPLKFVLIDKTKRFRKICAGIVKYYHVIIDDTGKKVYNTGVELSSRFRDLPTRGQKLRAERICLESSRSAVIRFCFDNKDHEYPIADFSKFSAAFYCSETDRMMFQISLILKNIAVYIDSYCAYNGDAIILKSYTDTHDKHRVVIQPQSSTIAVEEIIRRGSLQKEIKHLHSALQSFDAATTISKDFKAAVFDVHSYFEATKTLTESPRYAIYSSKDDEFLLNDIFPRFYTQIDNKITCIDSIISQLALSHEDHLLYKKFYQNYLLNFFLQGPINHRSYYKPCGYAGDYEIMRMNHENRFEGDSIFGKLIHKYSTDGHIGTTLRERTQYLANSLINYISKYYDKSINILSIASGPSLEISNIVLNHPKLLNKVTLTLLDQEIKALQFALNAIRTDDIGNNHSSFTINFIHDTIQTFLAQSMTQSNPATYDFIYSFGLFDYFDFTLAKYVIQNLLAMLNKNGKIIIANISTDGNNYKTLLEFSLDWYLIYRSSNDLSALATAAIGSSPLTYTINEIGNGSMKFLEIGHCNSER